MSALRRDVFEATKKFISESGFRLESFDDARPWGGFLVISEKNATEFIRFFFNGLSAETLAISGGRLSPKILIVAPGKRLSWQYHHRRAEIWRIVSGEVSISTGDTDTEKNLLTLKKDETIELAQGERHRLIGLDNWGIVAEIWRHTDADHPSDENDIVRVQDDFGR